MRQPTTAEVRLDQHKAASFGPAGPRHLAVLAVNESAAIEFRCRGTRRDGRSRPTSSVSGKCRISCGIVFPTFGSADRPPDGSVRQEVRAQLPLQSGGGSNEATRIGYGHLATTPTPSRDGVEEHVDRSQIHMARVFRRHCPAGDYRRCARWRDDLVQFAEIHRAHGRGGRAADGRERRHDLGSD